MVVMSLIKICGIRVGNHYANRIGLDLFLTKSGKHLYRQERAEQLLVGDHVLFYPIVKPSDL
jgi:hypothetical protein